VLDALARRVRRLPGASVERWRGRRDRGRLVQVGLGDLELRARDARAALQEAYAEYVGTVSAPEHAISLELAGVLDALCRILRPRAVADLGSGFSSYVLGRYAIDADADVVSVDADVEWLDRTRDFLARTGLTAGALVGWDEFAAADHDPFDLVLDDLGDIARRVDTMAYVLSGLARADGFVVVDDRHRPPVRAAIDRVARARGSEVVSLRSLTVDGFGRYACLVRVRSD
jgi:predicted O-methyltransferase YrrM